MCNVWSMEDLEWCVNPPADGHRLGRYSTSCNPRHLRCGRRADLVLAMEDSSCILIVIECQCIWSARSVAGHLSGANAQQRTPCPMHRGVATMHANWAQNCDGNTGVAMSDAQQRLPWVQKHTSWHLPCVASAVHPSCCLLQARGERLSCLFSWHAAEFHVAEIQKPIRLGHDCQQPVRPSTF